MKPCLETITAAIILGTGCLGCAMLRPYEYAVKFRNDSQEHLRDIRISYGKFSSASGSYLRVTEPLPKAATIEFRTPNGQLHLKHVTISDYIRRNIRQSDLYFRIQPDLEVQVELMTPKQIKVYQRELHRKLGLKYEE